VSDQYKWLLDILAIISGLHTLVVIGGHLRKRFWRTDAGEKVRSRSDYALGSFLALLCGFLWSLSYVSLKYTSHRLHAIDISAAVLGWAVFFLILARIVALAIERRRGQGQEPLPDWSNRKTALLALANIGNFGLSIYALYFISATQAMTLNNMSPLFLVAILLFRRKLRPSAGTFSSIVIVLLGAWIMTVGRDFSVASTQGMIGSLIAMGAGLSFAIWADLIDDVEGEIRLLSTRFGFLATIFFASFALAVTAAWLLAPTPPFSWLDGAILAANGLRVALVYVSFQLAVRFGGPLLAVVVAVSQVPLTLVWEAALLDLTIDSQIIIGVGAIVAGAVALLIDRTQAVPGTPAPNPAA